MQTGASTGHGGLYAAARDVWLWLEALAAAQDELLVTFAARTSDEGLSEVVEELQRSLGGPAIAEPVASYAAPGDVPLAALVQHWSHSQVSAGGRVCEPLPAGRGAALEATLAGACDRRIDEIRRRVAAERSIQGSTRRVGIVGEPQRDWLRSYFASTTHSASALDTLGICAFRYFAGTLLGLEREEVPTLGPDVREQGRAAHAGLQVVYRALIERGGLVAARSDSADTLCWAREVFDAHAEGILADVEVHPALRDAALEDAWSMVAAQLRRDLQEQSALEPVAVEYGFDDRARRPRS